jgi:predicted  nucleic acid-binding Zn-ribbon protein
MTISVFPGSIPALDIQLDSPEWFEWLATQSQFKYEGNLTTMSVKRRASNGKWYARKKVYSSDKGSTPVDLYIGADEECTAEKLREINYHFGQDWRNFWPWYHSPARKESKPKGVQIEEVYTEQLQLSQTRDETEELRARLAELEQSNSELQAANQALKEQLSECSQQTNSADADKEEIRRLNAELRLVKQQREDFQSKWERAKEDNGNLFRELKGASSQISELQFKKFQAEEKDEYIRELQNELLNRPDPATLIRRKITELGMQEKIMQHQRDPKTNARYWALAKLLEAFE